MTLFRGDVVIVQQLREDEGRACNVVLFYFIFLVQRFANVSRCDFQSNHCACFCSINITSTEDSNAYLPA